MKFIGQMLVGIITTLLVMTMGIAQINVEQAKQSIRSFEGDPNLELPEPKDDSNPDAPVARTFYRFDLPDGRIYEVDKETGWVFAADYGDSYTFGRQGAPISQEQAIQIARNFLQKRSVIFQRYQARMRVECKDYTDRYFIEFKERIPENGAYTYNECLVDVNPYSGKVISFFQMWESSPHPNRACQPVFTFKEAANSIAAYFGFSAWDFVKEPKLLALPANWAPFNWNTSGLVWSLDIVGNGGRGVQGFVDAMTGNILMTSKYRFAPSPYPKVDTPKVRLWVYKTERIEETPVGDLFTADGFALKGITPIIERVSYGSEFTWLPVEVFKRFGAKVTEAKGKVTLSTEEQSKVTDKFLRHDGQVYLPAKLLEELFPDKVIAVTTHGEGWVEIIIMNKECLKPFGDLREEIVIPWQNLRYKTKYRSFLDRRESQWAVRIGLISIICILSILFVWKRRRIGALRQRRD